MFKVEIRKCKQLIYFATWLQMFWDANTITRLAILTPG